MTSPSNTVALSHLPTFSPAGPALGRYQRNVQMLLAGELHGLLDGVVARADECAALDHAEPEVESDIFPMGEFVRMHPARDGQVLRRRLKVLSDREDVGPVCGNVAERLLDLGLL